MENKLTRKLTHGTLTLVTDMSLFDIDPDEMALVVELRRAIDVYERLVEVRTAMRSRGGSEVLMVADVDGFATDADDQPLPAKTLVMVEPRVAAEAMLDGRAYIAPRDVWELYLAEEAGREHDGTSSDDDDDEAEATDDDDPEPADLEDPVAPVAAAEPDPAPRRRGPRAATPQPPEPDPVEPKSEPESNVRFVVPELAADEVDQAALLWDWARTGSIKSACQRHKPSIPVSLFRQIRDAGFPLVADADRPVFFEHGREHLILAREGDSSGRWGRAPGTPMRRDQAFTIAHRLEMVDSATNDLVDCTFHDAATYLQAMYSRVA